MKGIRPMRIQIEIHRPRLRIERRAVRLQALLLGLILTLTVLTSRLRADTSCGGVNGPPPVPFNDAGDFGPFFCVRIAEAYFAGLTSGTTATTYSPAASVNRGQMAAFITSTLDQSLKRSHARAALGEWWTNAETVYRFSTYTGHNPQFLACDGQTVWVSNTQSNTLSRVDIKTGQLICTLTEITSPEQIVIVSGIVFIASYQSPGKIYQASFLNVSNGPVTPISVYAGSNPVGITYDGQNLWTANNGTGPGTGSVSRVNVRFFSVDTFSPGFSQPVGILFDGTNLWVTDQGDASLKRVDLNSGAVLQTIPLSGTVGLPVFDGTNLWVPCTGPDQVYVVRGAGGLMGTVLAQLTGNGLNGCRQAAFDGERICVSNSAGGTVSLWKASDLSPITSVLLDITQRYQSRGICSDGMTFFIGMRHPTDPSNYIVRF